jgi:hypothetical protein
MYNMFQARVPTHGGEKVVAFVNAGPASIVAVRGMLSANNVQSQPEN